MRRRQIIAVLFLLAASWLPALDNEPTGYRDLAWGVSVAEVDGMQVVKQAGATEYWLRPDEPLSVAGVDVDTVLYLSLEGRFEGIAAITGNAGPMHESLAAIYGEPDETEEGLSLWTGRSTVIILNEHDERAEMVICTMKYYATLSGTE